MKDKILIIGSARHAKNTVADIIAKKTGINALSSSMAALDIFLFKVLNEKYKLGYKSKEEAYEDRVNHRKIWYDEIIEYNKDDKLRLMKTILKKADIYIGLRSEEEIKEAIKKKLFKVIIGVINPHLPIESKESNSIDTIKYSDFIILNDGTLEDLETTTKDLVKQIFHLY